MIRMLLIQSIYMLRIQVKQNVNIVVKNVK